MTPRPDDPTQDPGDRPPPEDGVAGSSRKASTGGKAPTGGEADRRTPGSSGDQHPGDQQPGEAVGTTREPTPMTQQIGRVVIVLLAVLFGIFAVDNSHRVDFSWVFGESQVAPDGTGGVPLIVLLVAAAAIGLALGALIEWQFLRARRAGRERD